MNLPVWQVDAFTAEPFKGNPAAVCVYQAPLSDTLMQHIATEMNLCETAFVEMRGADLPPLLRWFTPTREIDLCGHATLSAAHILWEEELLYAPQITFETRFAGMLSVRKQTAGRYTLNFPTRAGEVVAPSDVPLSVLEGLGVNAPVIAARKARDLMLVFDDPAMIRALKPDFTTLRAYSDYLIVTAPSDEAKYDFISRFFCADDGITEDPVTGSAHCTLAPYWAKRLGKNTLRAYQASVRGGALELLHDGAQTRITGDAITILHGTLRL